MALIGRIFSELIEREADAYFTNKIKNFKGKIIGFSNDSELYGELNDVNGFRFLNLKILGPLNVHVYKGCKIIFESHIQNLEVESDSQEIFSDYSHKAKTGITELDVDLENVEEKLDAVNLKSIRIIIDKTTLLFTIQPEKFLDVIKNPVEPDDKEMGNESMDPFMQG